MNTEKTSGSCRAIFRMDSYGAQDKWSAAVKDGGTFARLMDEMAHFIDQRNEANQSTLMLRRVSDAAIWGE
jgi:hypothetical protein